MQQRVRWHTADSATGAHAGLSGHCQMWAGGRCRSGLESRWRHSCGGSQRSSALAKYPS